MAIDPNERACLELVDKYIAHHGRVDGMLKMAFDLCAYEQELMAAEAYIASLEARFLDQTSAGFLRRDVSSHYAPDWRPKAPPSDVTGDDWIATGREAA